MSTILCCGLAKHNIDATGIGPTLIAEKYFATVVIHFSSSFGS